MMSQGILRAPLMLAVVGGFACVALWSVVVRPMRANLDQERHQASVQSELLASGARDMSIAVDAPEDLAESFEAELNRVTEWWGVSGDAGAVYSRFDEFAIRSGVKIERIEPGRKGVSNKRQGVYTESSGFMIELHGSFENVCEFVGLVQRGTGLSRVVSLRITPNVTGSKLGEVTANLMTDHMGVYGLVASVGEE